MNIKKIAVADIDDAHRLRPVDRAYAKELAASFEDRGGMMTPIEVRKVGERFKLIAGAHRLAAAKLLGWETIDAIIFAAAAHEVVPGEIDENLVRHDLTYLDRAIAIAERQRIFDERHPDAPRGKAGAMARWHATKTVLFASDTAEKLGVSEVTVRNWLDFATIVKSLSPEIRARLVGTDLANRRAEIIALAGLDDDEARHSVLDLLLADREDRPRKVKKALATLANRPVEHRTREGNAFDKFKDAWERYPSFRDLVRSFIADQDGNRLTRTRRGAL
jgi:ParB family transcriptional regulator, chromosome partitioning protein